MKSFVRSFGDKFNAVTSANCNSAAFSCEACSCDRAEKGDNSVILSGAVFAASVFVIFLSIRLRGIIIPAIFGIIIGLILLKKNTVTCCNKIL